MSERRAPDAPGTAVPVMSTQCGYDAGITGGPVCPNPATVHLFAGQAPDKPSDWAMQACPEHLPQAMLIAYDWHELAPACVAPDAMWNFRNHQGEGFCYWPEAEAAIHEAISEPIKEGINE